MTDATQQPDPFSELRGLIERASPRPWFQGMKGGGNVQSRRGPVADTLRFGNTSSEAVADYDNARLIVAAVNSLGPLLDERDRLIGENEALLSADREQHVRKVETGYHKAEAELTARAISAEGEVEKLQTLIGNVFALGFTPTLIAETLEVLTARKALSQEIG